MVPSLNVNTSCFALSIPFSIGSGNFDSEIIPTTPLTSSTRLTLTLSEAFLSIAARGIVFKDGFPISVGLPHFGQSDPKELIPQSGLVHFLLEISTLILPFLAAVATSLLDPPLFPIGINPCGAGLINLSFDFSGLPTRVPMYAGALFMILILEISFKASRVVSFSGNFWVNVFMSEYEWSLSIIILLSRTRWGTPIISRILFW